MLPKGQIEAINRRSTPSFVLGTTNSVVVDTNDSQNGAGYRIRTDDLLFTREMLYQLS